MEKKTLYIVNLKFVTIAGTIVSENVPIVASTARNAEEIVKTAYSKQSIQVEITTVTSKCSAHVEKIDLLDKQDSTKHPFGLADIDMISNKIEDSLKSINKHIEINSSTDYCYCQGKIAILQELKNYIEDINK